ncbi:MAG: hypothetical protein M3N26_09470, partial [Pseudomonadota bacterium]|nr:hypothetical protein [Pseudomonadota bacterium]
SEPIPMPMQASMQASMQSPAQPAEPAPRANPFRPAIAPRVEPAAEIEPVYTPAPPPSAGRSLFEKMTRSMRRPALPEPTEPQRAEPSFSNIAPQAASQPQHNGDETLEIPAFLRRQTS